MEGKPHSKHKLWFTSPAHLKQWLARKGVGRRILGELIDERCGECGANRTAVLMVVHSDGWIEVYGEKNLDAKIVVKPHTETTAGAILAEEYLDVILPERYGSLYFPRNLRATGRVERVTAEDLVETQLELAMLEELRKYP